MTATRMIASSESSAVPGPRFAALIPVGPGTRELSRLQDLLESLWHNEPAVACVLLVDDGGHGSALVPRSHRGGTCELISIPNPRRGRGDGWAGGLCVGLLAGLARLQQHCSDLEFILRLDTDALCIAPFAAKISAKFRARRDIGVLGTHRLNPDGRSRNYQVWAPSIRTFLWPVRLRGRYLQVTLFGRPRKIRRVLIAALSNGYELAEHCQGGGYAINAQLVRRMWESGHLDDPLCWLRSGLGEDVMLGMYARAMGMTLCDYNDPGEPFAVQYLGLPDRPEALVAKGYSIIHSVKDHGQLKEEEIRAFFRSTRTQVPQQVTETPLP